MSDGERSYKVGKGKPPEHGKIKPGEQRNPHGRPKGSKNMSSILRKVGSERLPYSENGKSGTISKLEATIKKLYVQALSGDSRATKLVLEYAQLAERNAQAPPDGASRKALDDEIMKSLKARLVGPKQSSNGDDDGGA